MKAVLYQPSVIHNAKVLTLGPRSGLIEACLVKRAAKVGYEMGIATVHYPDMGVTRKRSFVLRKAGSESWQVLEWSFDDDMQPSMAVDPNEGYRELFSVAGLV